MHDLIQQTFSHARGMWRFRWRALVVSWLACVIGWAVVYSLPNVYEATTRVFVDTDSVLRPLLRGLTTESNVMNQVNMMTRALLSRPHLEEVARETDLDLRADTPREMEGLIDKLQTSIQIRQSRDRLYTISFRDRDPRTAHAVVQTLLSNFVGDTLQGNRSDSQVAMRFLNEQIAEHELRLVDAEERLAEFKKENVGVMPNTTGDYYARLQASTATLQELEAQLGLAQRTRLELLHQLETEEPVLRVDSVTSEYDLRIAAAENNLRDLSLQYTDRHPDVIALQDTLERLKEQRDDAVARGTAGGTTDPADLNPVYQSMKIELNTTEVEVAQLRAKIEQQRQTVLGLQRSVDTIPGVEAELTKLNRDYEVTKARYEALLDRFESARLTENAEQSSEDVKFRVIDPPTIPLDPIGPNRILFLWVALVFGLAGGGLFAYSMNQIDPVFGGLASLAPKTGVSVLGTISVILTPGQKFARRLQMGVFMLGLTLLLSAFVAAIMLRAPAVLLASKIVARISA
ncbi:MAG: chain length-determining protein [Gammaproteobacteria bacterium]|nr:chain length-determining protein [Gammaproteobacteria bacterium]